jgi:hypothetical protein
VEHADESSALQEYIRKPDRILQLKPIAGTEFRRGEGFFTWVAEGVGMYELVLEICHKFCEAISTASRVKEGAAVV